MSSLVQFFKVLALCLGFILVTCCLLNEQVTGAPVPEEKRDIYRYPRAKYRVGYMFGKRGSSSPASSVLFDIVSRNMITRKELQELAIKNRHLLNEIATILDKNGDGYISTSDLL